jgi:tetratricopeptide (TPR) repeat protein
VYLETPLRKTPRSVDGGRNVDIMGDQNPALIYASSILHLLEACHMNRWIGLVLFASVAGRASLALAAEKPEKLADKKSNVEARRAYDDGTKFYNLGDFDRAISNYRKAFEIKPEPVFLYNIAQAYRLKGDLRQAVFFYKSYLRASPNADNRAEVEGRIKEMDALLDKHKATMAQPPNDIVEPSGKKPKAATKSDTGRFDGIWDVILACPPQEGALGYTYEFVSYVNEGLLHAQYGTEGVAPCLTLDGKINPDGDAVIKASGLTGDPRYAIKNNKRNAPYSYHIDASFSGSRGIGKQIGYRVCNFTFVKR